MNIDFISSMNLIKWKSEAGEIKLKKVFENISLTRNDIKLRNLQHTLPHRILPTNRILVMIGINESVQ
jgi:hypothetical protein